MDHKVSRYPEETWPKQFLVFSINHLANDVSARSQIITAHNEQYESAQDFAEQWFQDPAIMRIYELRQMYAIGKFRGQ